MQQQYTRIAGRRRTSAVGKLDQSATHRQQCESRVSRWHSAVQRLTFEQHFRRVTANFDNERNRGLPRRPMRGKIISSENARADGTCIALSYIDFLEAPDDAQTLSKWCSRDVPRRNLHHSACS